MRALPTLFFLLLLCALPLGAQSVRGVLVEQGSGTPVPGTLVVLLDGGGAQRGRVLTDSAGRFVLHAPAPGSYRLRAERIGHTGVTFPALALEEGEALDYRLEAPAQVVELEGLVVRGTQRRCARRPGAGEAVATLWEEARKALNAAAHTEEKRLYRFVTARWEREVELRTRRVTREKRNTRTASSSNPFVSISPEELQRGGYVQDPAGEEGAIYYAPDARVLLSDEFLDGHCFRIRPGEGEWKGQIGLAFEPVRARPVPDVQGVLWVDAGSAELRALEYHYTGLKLSGATGEIGGRVDFQRLPSGAWIVQRWQIRMPTVGRQVIQWRGRMQGEREFVVGFREEGGEVVEFLAPDGTRFAGAARSTLTGTVRDADRDAPLAGARVFVAGTEHATETDAGGRFRMEGLPEGRYAVGFSHPSLDSVGFSPGEREVVLRRGEATPLTLSVSRAAVIAALCPEGLTPGHGVVAGAVRDPGSGQTLPGAEVSVSWKRYDVAGPSAIAIQENRSGFQLRSDARGLYSVCGVPEDVTVTVQASLADGRIGAATLKVLPGSIHKQDVLPVTPAALPE